MNNLAAALPRNARCPCGSGRRYKQCCGEGAAAAMTQAPSTYLGWDAFAPEEREALWQTMREALAAQQRLRLDVAGPLYAQVVARAPLTVDAVHMLGVVRLMEGKLDAAESLLKRARELAPDDASIRQNLLMLAHRRQEFEGLHSVRATVARDMLRLFGASCPLAPPNGRGPFAPASPARGAPFHVVIPGDVANAGSNRTGIALARRLGGIATLWGGPGGDASIATAGSARLLGEERAAQPAGGTLALFGLNARTLTWLPAAAASFDSIIVALDAHDATACVELLGRLPPDVTARVHFVARCAALLDDFGLPGTVDPMLFDGRPRPHRVPPRHARMRIGVFIPALHHHEDEERWRMLEWLRERCAFLRVLYAGRLPSRHVPNADEHLVGLATEWEGWADDLDALFYWSAEGNMRQFDRLVFEAIARDLPVVGDGFGDFGAALATRDDCAQFFDPAAARSAMEKLIARDATAELAKATS